LGDKRGAGHQPDLRLPQPLPQTFVIEVEKSPVVNDRATEIRTELIQQEWVRRRAREWRPGIENVTPVEIEDAAMQAVRARTRSDGNLSARRHAGVGGEILRLHLKCGDRVKRDGQSHIFFLRLVQNP